MRKNLSATSIIEAMVVMLIVVTATVGIYQVYLNSFKLQTSTANRITAIQIAREGIEAMSNIRDTNAMLFSADLANCWNVLNYNSACIGNTTTTNDIANNGSYTVYKDSDNKWKLTSKTTGLYSNATYRSNFKVNKDTLGFYTQSGGTDFLPVFTREILVSYIDTNGGSADSNDEKMEIKAIVQWADNASKNPHKIEVKQMLSNWKSGK